VFVDHVDQQIAADVARHSGSMILPFPEQADECITSRRGDFISRPNSIISELVRNPCCLAMIDQMTVLHNQAGICTFDQHPFQIIHCDRLQAISLGGNRLVRHPPASDSSEARIVLLTGFRQ